MNGGGREVFGLAPGSMVLSLTRMGDPGGRWADELESGLLGRRCLEKPCWLCPFGRSLRCLEPRRAVQAGHMNWAAVTLQEPLE